MLSAAAAASAATSLDVFPPSFPRVTGVAESFFSVFSSVADDAAKPREKHFDDENDDDDDEEEEEEEEDTEEEHHRDTADRSDAHPTLLTTASGTSVNSPHRVREHDATAAAARFTIPRPSADAADDDAADETSRSARRRMSCVRPSVRPYARTHVRLCRWHAAPPATPTRPCSKP
jgi:hypothetical protein